MNSLKGPGLFKCSWHWSKLQNLEFLPKAKEISNINVILRVVKSKIQAILTCYVNFLSTFLNRRMSKCKEVYSLRGLKWWREKSGGEKWVKLPERFFSPRLFLKGGASLSSSKWAMMGNRAASSELTLVAAISLKPERAHAINTFGLEHNCPLVIISSGRELPNSNISQRSNSSLMFVNRPTSSLLGDRLLTLMCAVSLPLVIKRYLQQEWFILRRYKKKKTN